VDGFGWSTIGAVDYAWYEVTNYRIAPSFIHALGIYVNKDSYDACRTPEAEVNRIAAEFDAETYSMMGVLVQKEFAELEAKGMRTYPHCDLSRSGCTRPEAGGKPRKNGPPGCAEVRPCDKGNGYLTVNLTRTR
jgi:hypothetical protein